ncbi:unnamed protein product, partial [Rotaria magnacalcarata]
VCQLPATASWWLATGYIFTINIFQVWQYFCQVWQLPPIASWWPANAAADILI